MSTPKLKGLGKGLGALFEDVNVRIDGRENETGARRDDILFISIHNIRPNQNQPRQQFSEENIAELAVSIKEHGILQPLLVRPSKNGYEIIAGERRWRAARKAELKEVPCLVRELDDEQNLLVALIENMQREDLNSIEEAIGIDRMLHQYGLTQETVAKSLGKSRPYISNAIRLLKLPETIQAMVINKELSSGHARAIAGIETAAGQLKAAERCLEGNWSVREIEKYIQNGSAGESRKKPRPNRIRQDLKHVEEDLRQILGTKVRITPGIRKSKIEIEYYSQEELERLVGLLTRA